MEQIEKKTTCALCLKTKELQSSHIIPEFFYRRLYDEKSRARILSGKTLNSIPIQKGFREYLLCHDCEQQFGRYERYVSEIWNSKFPEPLSSPPSATSLQCPEFEPLRCLDYKKFKLFHLSVLWRAGVTTHPFFEKVTLGPFQEELRLMLKAEEPGRPDQFPMFAVIQHMNTSIIDTVTQPVPSKIEGITIYTFTFGGVAWQYFVSKRPPNDIFRSAKQPIKLPLFSESGVLHFGKEDIMKSLPFKSIFQVSSLRDSGS